MLTFKTLEGNTLQYGETEVPELEDEKAFILKLDEQLRAADLASTEQTSTIQYNLNQISDLLGLDKVPENGTVDDPTASAIDYFVNNRQLFIDHGISNHIRAKELEKMTNPAFTPTEYAPTIEEMQKLEVDIGRLYNDEG